jgi:hypothetical protein
MLQFRASKCRPVWCVQLPAGVTFPTDRQLLERIEKSRNTLPVNSIKPLLLVRCAETARSPAKDERRTQRITAA